MRIRFTYVVVAVVVAVGATYGLTRLVAETPPPVGAATVGVPTEAPETAAPATPAPPAEAAQDDRGRVMAPASDEPLVVVRGSVPGTTLGLLSLRRAGPKVLVVSVRVSAQRSVDELDASSMRFDRLASADLDASGFELRDAATGRAIRPALTETGECDCSLFMGLDPGQSADVGATFRMPTAEGPFVLRVPGFPEIAGIEPAAE